MENCFRNKGDETSFFAPIQRPCQSVCLGRPISNIDGVHLCYVYMNSKMVADFKPGIMKRLRILPGRKVLALKVTIVGYKECGSKSQLFEKGGYE